MVPLENQKGEEMEKYESITLEVKYITDFIINLL